ncbi:Zn-dependent hydrolase [Cryobacterium algoricola]|uniref:Zn-dependent hydrolase n=1 Tax=Cryobacterium algoricola TaxID=1259183 RepID=A0ABY2IAH8_9MICO|nr:Zn-dependent hydrolase [Cryobacterium algoricola]TFB83787.1 Zn-dependent hydrolase [Cryobacterium algoricola]
MTAAVPTVSDAEAAVILARCDELARHSSLTDGIERTYLSAEHAAVNYRVAGWMTAAGLTTWQDAAGNQCARLSGSTRGLPALMLGSHLDTVRAAGRYDGILGVLVAIAVAGRIAASGRPLPFALEIAAFGDEEGTRFGTTLLGSRAVAGTWLESWWDLRDAGGVSLREAFLAFGLDPAKVGDAARAPQELLGYLEAHIEQGPVLEEEGRALGVVTGIAGARRFLLTVTGSAGHSGTPWPRRRDALAGAAEGITTIERIARAEGLTATVGHLRVFPDAVNVIPGKVEFSLDLRAPDDADRDRGWTLIESALTDICGTRGLDLASTQVHEAAAVACSPRLRAAIAAGIRSTEPTTAPADAARPDEGGSDSGPEAPADDAPRELPSIAGHDAMAIAAITDVGMLFVRCAGGISHHPDESVTAADVALAVDALEVAVRALAADYPAL